MKSISEYSFQQMVGEKNIYIYIHILYTHILYELLRAVEIFL